MAYPITYACDFAERRSRLSTFFRYLLALPHFLVVAFYAIAAAFAVVIAWFSIVLSGSYPGALYNLNAGFLRYVARLNGYVSLATDRYPPFSGGEAPDYPVRLSIAPPLPAYDRLKTALRIILMIPVYLIAYALQIVTLVAAVISWFWIVITGRQNPALHAAINLGLSYNMKAYGYYLLLTETWPPFSDDGEALPAAASPAGLTAPPVAPEAPAAATGQASLRGSDIGLPDDPPDRGTPGMTSGDPLS